MGSRQMQRFASTGTLKHHLPDVGLIVPNAAAVHLLHFLVELLQALLLVLFFELSIVKHPATEAGVCSGSDKKKTTSLCSDLLLLLS